MNFNMRHIVRVAGLKVLKATGRDITIDHHWVPAQKLRIHSFKHKGYWWHGKRREEATLASIANFVRPGQTVFDVGAHIGYFTTYFAHLVGPTGHVFAFEPSDENLAYTRPNISQLTQVQLDTRGISNFCGEASFFVESLTGQNNSLVGDYEVFAANAANAGVACVKREVKIKVTTIDNVCREWGVAPAFIKMDIEGAEFEAVQGMLQTLQSIRPVVLLEVSRQHHECWEFFKAAGYDVLDESLQPVADSDFAAVKKWPGPVNYFFVPKSKTPSA
jgi:FkbM family methyltransferase